MKVRVLAIALLVLGALVFAWLRWGQPGPAEKRVVLTPGPAQPRVAPAEAGIDAAALDEAADYARTRGARALVVTRGWHVVYEKYWGDTHFDARVAPAGFAPALTALAAGVALNDRQFAGIDVPLGAYLPAGAADAAEVRTLRQVLTHQVAGTDPAADANLLARALEQATGQAYDTLIAEKLWRPIEGGDIAFGLRETNGAQPGIRADCCVRARIDDWVRLGVLLANGGVFEGNQLTLPGFTQYVFDFANARQAAGAPVLAFAARDTRVLGAAGDSRLWVAQSLELSILLVGGASDDAREFVATMIPDTIVHGTRGWSPQAPGEVVDPKNFAPH